MTSWSPSHSDSIHPNTLTLLYVDQNRNYLSVKIERLIEQSNINDVTQSLIAWLGINDHFLHSPYILRIEMG